jgi:aminoglycoside N3'-acetyltransferase
MSFEEDRMDPVTAPVTPAALRRGIRGHDLSGKIVVVHSSLASFGTVEGGAAASWD